MAFEAKAGGGSRTAPTDVSLESPSVGQSQDGDRPPVVAASSSVYARHELIFPDLGRFDIGSAEDSIHSTPAGSSVPRKRGVVTMSNTFNRLPFVDSGSIGQVKSESQPGAKKVVFFDLETQKLAQDVGGWKNIRRMQLSVGVVHTEAHGFLTFTEETVSDLINLLKTADLVVGFNHLRFDYEVLRAYTNENLEALPNLDILADVEASLGFRLSLDHLAQYTLGKNKSAAGTDAVKWFREGRMDLLEQYCRDDVAITRDLYLFGVGNGFLRYKRKGGRTDKVPVQWQIPL